MLEYISSFVPPNEEEISKAIETGNFHRITRAFGPFELPLFKVVAREGCQTAGYPSKRMWRGEATVAVPLSPSEIGLRIQLCLLDRVARQKTAYGMEFYIEPDGSVAGSSSGALTGDHWLAKFEGRVTPLSEIAQAIAAMRGFTVEASGDIRLVPCARRRRL